jgi:hypothetical protein
LEDFGFSEDDEDGDEGEDEEVAHFGFWGTVVLLHLNL